jgi:hypothetical protein
MWDRVCFFELVVDTELVIGSHAREGQSWWIVQSWWHNEMWGIPKINVKLDSPARGGGGSGVLCSDGLHVC